MRGMRITGESGNCFDLLVSEAQLGGLDGRALAESFKSACPSGRIILTSGDSTWIPPRPWGGGPLMFLSWRIWLTGSRRRLKTWACQTLAVLFCWLTMSRLCGISWRCC